MTQKHQKIITAVFIGLVSVLGLEALVYIMNLNQAAVFVKAAFFIWLFLAFKISLLYDLHFKNPGALKRAKARAANEGLFFKVILSALADRLSHLLKKHHWLQFQNYLILPGFLFWSTAALIFLDFDFGGHRLGILHLFVILSSAALIVTYWYLKEAFSRKNDLVDRDIFAGLAGVKIYASTITFAAAFGLMSRLCDPWLFSAAIFSLTFLFIYQALFQQKLATIKNLAWTILISLGQAAIAFWVYEVWSFDYYTAGIFMAASYNFLWGVFHYKLEGTFSWRVFFEILLVCGAVALMVASVTNFKAGILGMCSLL